MYYAPHLLQHRVITGPDKDEWGRPVPGTGGETWADVCRCRCDDNTTQKFTSENGTVYRPKYHVVCERITGLEPGDYVRCMNGDDVRGEGEVYILKSTNYLGYSELWLE